MLTRSKHKETCPCCGNYRKLWVYRWHEFWYCSRCLHSIGVKASDASGSYEASDAQYSRAWAEMAGNAPDRYERVR